MKTIPSKFSRSTLALAGSAGIVAVCAANWIQPSTTTSASAIDPPFIPLGCTPALAPSHAPAPNAVGDATPASSVDEDASTPRTTRADSQPALAPDPLACSAKSDEEENSRNHFYHHVNVSYILKGTKFKAVAMNESHACAIMADDKVICWGKNRFGQAPPGVSADTFKAIAVGTAHPLWVRNSFTGESRAHSCGIRIDGKVVCWGSNDEGQAPSEPSVDSFQAIAAGAWHTCGIRTNGKVVCWGNNANGQAPKGPSVDSFKAISAGVVRTCGIRTDDKLVCWGDDEDNDAPTGPSVDSFKAVSVGKLHTCGIKTNNRVVCFSDAA